MAGELRRKERKVGDRKGSFEKYKKDAKKKTRKGDNLLGKKKKINVKSFFLVCSRCKYILS
jgi:hypothetical protein